MAVRTRDEILEAINTHLGDDNSDSVLSLVEDITDTFDSLTGNTGGENWEQKYKDNDAAWRKKYRDRFFGKNNDKDDDDIDDSDDKKKKNKPRTFAELFK